MFGGNTALYDRLVRRSPCNLDLSAYGVNGYKALRCFRVTAGIHVGHVAVKVLADVAQSAHSDDTLPEYTVAV